MPRRKRPKAFPAQSKLVKGPKPTTFCPTTPEHDETPKPAATLDSVCRPGQGISCEQGKKSRRTGQVSPLPKKRKRQFSSSAEERPPRSPTLWPPVNEASAVAPEAKKRCGVPHRATFTSSYVVGELLGSGGYGSVYAGTRRSDGEEVAIKYVTKTKRDKYIAMPGDGRRLPEEVALMTIVNQPFACVNILKLLDWFEEPDRYILVLERPSPCTDLFEFVQMFGGRLSEIQARQIMRQVIEALIHCRDHGVFHRDVKSENILVNLIDWTVKLIDFGCGTLDNNNSYSHFVGTWDYCPPEFYRNRSYQADPSTTWSLGVLLFELVCGNTPFGGRKAVLRNQPKFAAGLSKECHDLLKWCLSTNPEDRPVLEDILSHDWLAGYWH